MIHRQTPPRPHLPGDALNVTTAALSLNFADVDASRDFFCTCPP
ncbi:hypothetical protein [Streptomyces sp. NPDC056491]